MQTECAHADGLTHWSRYCIAREQVLTPPDEVITSCKNAIRVIYSRAAKMLYGQVTDSIRDSALKFV
jgi:hypothetical protein